LYAVTQIRREINFFLTEQDAILQRIIDFFVLWQVVVEVRNQVNRSFELLIKSVSLFEQTFFVNIHY
jgi:hypothetical protein